MPFLAARRFGRAPTLDLDVTVHEVELGLEEVHPGAATPPPAPPPAPVPAPALTSPPPPPAPSSPPHAAPHPHHAPATAPPPDLADELPAPSTQLREPELAVSRLHPAATEPPAPPPVAPADAGAVGAAALPSIAAASSDLAPMVPRGALVSLLLRCDHLRENPNARAVGRLLAAVPDWDEMLGGTSLDPIHDLDSVVLAAAQPFGTATQPPDWFVIAKGAGGSDAPLREAVEEMVAQASPAPSPVAPPELDGGAEDPAEDSPSARAADAGRDPWQHLPNGVRSVTLERYRARRTFLLLGHGTAAIALPSQVQRLLAVNARRASPLAGANDPRLVLLLESEGTRNLLSFNTYRGPFPVPTRAALALYQTLSDAGAATGGAELLSTWQYDSPEQAQGALDMMEYSRTRWHAMIDAQLGARGGLNRLLIGAVAGIAGIDIPSLESAIDALQFQTEGDKLVLRGTLSPTQVRAVLGLAAMGR